MRRLATQSTILASLAIIAGCVGQDRQDTITKCFAQALNGPWTTAQVKVDVSTPDRCPFSIAVGLTKEQEFVGIVTGSAQYIGSNGYVGFDQLSNIKVRVFNWRSQLVNKGGTTPGFIFEGQPPRAPVRAIYTAGTAGYTNLFDQKGTDNGIMDIVLRDQATVAQGFAKLTFTYLVPAVIAGPASVTVGQNFSLSTTVSNYRPALTYKWWRNGVLLSGTTWSGFTTAAPPAGTSVTYKVEVTDADGDKGTDTHVVVGKAVVPPGGGGGGGGGCLRLQPDSGRSGGVQRVGDSLTANMELCPPPPNP